MRRSRTRGSLMMERVTPRAGMRIWTGAGGGVGVGVGVAVGMGVAVGVWVGMGVAVGVGDGVQVMAGTGRPAISSPHRNRCWPISQVFSIE